jgi:3-demethylubiquinone-9 3-methyltransferase
LSAAHLLKRLQVGAALTDGPDGRERPTHANKNKGAFAMTPKQKITLFMWFDNNAEEAMNHYVSIFKNARIVGVSRYGDALRHRNLA